MQHEKHSIASQIRDLLKSRHGAMSIPEMAQALPGMTEKQVRAACFEMAKRGAVVKCGNGARQLFKLGSQKRTFNVPIAPPISAPTSAAPKAAVVETVEEWKRRTGRDIQRLPIGATAFPPRRIAA